MAEQQQTNPEAVDALARALDPLAFAGDGDVYREARVTSRFNAHRILLRPGPLLEVLAQAGLLQEVYSIARNDPQPSMGGPRVQHAGESTDREVMQAALDMPRSEGKWIDCRYVSPWKPTDPEETP